MTPTVVSSVRPVAFLVHLVHRHAFPRPVGGRRVGLLEQRRFGSLAAVALCLARRRRRFVPLGSGDASARSAAAAVLLARRLRRFCSLGGGGAGSLGGGSTSIRSAAARTVCVGGIAFATVANLCLSGLALGFVGRP